MKTIKKILAALMCLIMLMGIIPFQAIAASIYINNTVITTDKTFAVGEKIPWKDHFNFDENVNVTLFQWSYFNKELNAFALQTAEGGPVFLNGVSYELDIVVRVKDGYKFGNKDFAIVTPEGTHHYTRIRTSDDSKPDPCTVYRITFGIYTASDWDKFQELLERESNLSIILSKDIKREVALGDSKDSASVCTSVKGKKCVDLNGYDLEVIDRSNVTSDNDHTRASATTLFDVTSSADLTMNDTVGTSNVKYDSHYISTGVALFDSSFYSHVCRRDLFKVSGRLTINGGEYDAGGAKEQYLSDKCCNAYQVTSGFVFNNVKKDATVTINSGVFNEFRHIKDTVIYRTSEGTINIYGGQFNYKGSSANWDFDGLNIYGGTFETTDIGKVRIPHYDPNHNEYMSSFAGLFVSDEAWMREETIAIAGETVYKHYDDISFAENSQNYIDGGTNKPVVFMTPAFKNQTPEMPEGYTVTSLVYYVGDSEEITCSKMDFDKHIADEGYRSQVAMTIYNSDGNAVVTISSSDKVSYNISKLTKPGKYTVVQCMMVFKDKTPLYTLKHNFLLNLYTDCTHNYTVIGAIETATCVKSGINIEKCVDCGQTKESFVPVLGHTYEEQEGKFQWSSDENNHWKYCYRCDSVTAKASHSFKNGVCTVCEFDTNCQYGDAMDMERNETHHWWACESHSEDEACPNDHKLEYGAHEILTLEDLEGTSMEGVANTIYNCEYGYCCKGCGCYFGETGNHTWELMARAEPTCNADGAELYRCTNHNKTDPFGNKVSCKYKKVILPATGKHNYELISDTSTCSKDGVQTFKCKSCSATQTAVSPATGHSWSLESDTATCDKAGTKAYACSACTEKKTEASPAKGHNYVETKCVLTCAEECCAEYECSVCGKTKTEKLEQIEHTYTDDTDADCDICGYNRVEHCECKCHQGGIAGFFYKIVLFFQKLFGNNKVCVCGAEH